MNTPLNEQIVSLALTGVAYNYEGKKELTSLQRRWMKALVAHLGLADGSYEIRVNQGGDAVAADVTLQTDELYVQFSSIFPSLGILFRSCKGRSDCRGDRNHWVSVETFGRYGLDNTAAMILSESGAHKEIAARLTDNFYQLASA